MGYYTNRSSRTRPVYRPAPYQAGTTKPEEPCPAGWDDSTAHPPIPVELPPAPSAHRPGDWVFIAESADDVRALAAKGIGVMPTAIAREESMPTPQSPSSPERIALTAQAPNIGGSALSTAIVRL